MPNKHKALVKNVLAYVAAPAAAVALGIGPVAAQSNNTAQQKAPTNTPPPASTGRAAEVSQGADLTREKFLLQMDNDFRIRDTNGDGQISRVEIENYERRIAMQKAVAANRDLFKKLDKDQNNMLTPSEFLALVGDKNVIDVSPTMQRFDKNKDQIITLVEYRIATLANFDQLDRDKDGRLSQSELNYFKLDSSNKDAR